MKNLLKCKENNARKISEVRKCKEDRPFEAEVLIIHQHLNKSRRRLHRHL